MTGFMLMDSTHNPFEEPFVPEPGPQPKDIECEDKIQAVHKGFGVKVRDTFAGLFVSKPAKAIDPCQGDFEVGVQQ
jgi:hypothetical protein